MSNGFAAPESVSRIRLGQNDRFDAWLYSMLIDNNLAFHMNPDIIASPEQLAFMVHLGQDQVYLPCSDATFALLCASHPCFKVRRRHDEGQKPGPQVA